METGLTPGNFGVINDPDYRWELYMDWKSSQEDMPNFGAERFCDNKGITQQTLGEIVREFDSLNTGNRWGVNNGIVPTYQKK